MSKVVLDVSMSLDGFTAGPNVRDREPMGDGGEGLHDWMAGKGPDGGVDIGVRRQVDATVGATVIGRRTFDLGLGPWGGTPWAGVPSFVVTHRTREDLLGDNGGTFAFDGLQAAVRRAKDAAGDNDVLVLGAHVARQLLRRGPARRGAHPPRPSADGGGHAAVRRGAGRADPRGETRLGGRDPPALPRREALMPVTLARRSGSPHSPQLPPRR